MKQKGHRYIRSKGLGRYKRDGLGVQENGTEQGGKQITKRLEEECI